MSVQKLCIINFRSRDQRAFEEEDEADKKKKTQKYLFSSNFFEELKFALILTKTVHIISFVS